MSERRALAGEPLRLLLPERAAPEPGAGGVLGEPAGAGPRRSLRGELGAWRAPAQPIGSEGGPGRRRLTADPRRSLGSERRRWRP